MRLFPRSAALAATVLMLSAACGSSGGASASPSPTARGFAAYAACLRRRGVDVPTARPSRRRSDGFRGGAGSPTPRPSGRRSGGGFFGGANAAAQRACRSLAPQRRRPGLQVLQAYRECLADHGVRLPSPAPDRSPRAGRFGRLDTADPAVAKAVRTCRPLLPSFSPRPSPS